ncbi:DNA-directed RNA polymerase subunit delta [Dolosicoccus paucivorans]|uniref:Probable DNA-directed RNA polymerase subunit delta n=1 Tax=Dolosicoccus paucivorans TaxID=84521 RepID=A0A2N6SN81_9LACT|nr:DNA-directed RNA polymerase subunit delta [Dolosicoccus paucivorans]PMB84248.1 DNA-directed RNA polymerase subunit delta [Dolosicoccus paucivorans]PMC58506.1 DNA-directed RNA polymerase subunit delta [Dolosicoccus paucivorans]
MELEQLKGQNKEELSFIEVAYALLERQGDVVDFTELLVQIQDYLELSQDEIESKMTRFYTDLNIDGRFISLGENRWGLRAWYPIDAIDEEIISSMDDEDLPARRRKKRKLNAFAEDGDMIDYNNDDPEDYDGEEFDDELDDEDDEDPVVEVVAEDDDEDDEELKAYASDLDELGEEEVEEVELDEEGDEYDDDEE